MKLNINPDYEKLLPRLEDEEYQALKKSINESGLHYPITCNSKYVILDGHNRFRALMDLGKQITADMVTVKPFFDELEEKRFVIESNLKRRHLNQFQKAELAQPLLEIERDLAKKRMSLGPKNILGSNDPTLTGKAVDIVAEKIGMAPKTLQRSNKVIKEGSEETKELVRSGEISITEAYNRTKPVTSFPSPRASEHRVSEYTESQTSLMEELSKRGFNYLTEQVIYEDSLMCFSCSKSFMEKDTIADIVRCPFCGKDINRKAYKIDILIDKKLVVEVDGKGHAFDRDIARDQFLRDHGYEVLHFSNEDVKTKITYVFDVIDKKFRDIRESEKINQIMKDPLERLAEQITLGISSGAFTSEQIQEKCCPLCKGEKITLKKVWSE